MKTNEKKHRSIAEIAAEIKSLWKKPYFGAVPYLNAMFQLNTINDNYMFDSAKDIILYFLANANTFRGEDARRIKKELNEIINS